PWCGFDELAQPVRERIDFLDQLQPDPQGSRAYEVQANWALYCDNYLEGFHIPFVHPDLARVIDYTTYRTELFPWASLQIGHGADSFPGSDVAAYYFFLFPNLMLNFYPWGLSLNIVVPLAVDRTRVIYRTFVHEPSRRGGGAGAALDKVEL